MTSERIKIPNSSINQTFKLPKTDFYSGLVSFKILIDSNSLIQELAPFGESNNDFNFFHQFSLSKPLVIYPSQNSIVNSGLIPFTIQLENNTSSVNLLLEIDTTAKFNSSIKSTFTLATKEQLISQKLSVPIFNNTDYFYRVKSENNGQESNWSEGSLALLVNKSNGWSEGNFINFLNSKPYFLNFDTTARSFDFERKLSEGNYFIATAGSGNKGYWRRYKIAGELARINNYAQYGVAISAINPDTEIRYSDESKFNVVNNGNYFPPIKPAPFYEVGNKTGCYLFNTSLKEDRDSFINFLTKIPKNYYIIMMNGAKDIGIENWEPEVYAKLSEFGVIGLENLKEGEPFGVFGKKGYAAGKADQIFADYTNSVTSPQDQVIEFSTVIFPKVGEGSITSEKIGPASNWNEIQLAFKNWLC